mgnify:CR=1 FL=1
MAMVRTLTHRGLWVAVALLSSCVGEGSDFHPSHRVGGKFVEALARGDMGRAFYFTCQGRTENAPELPDPAITTTPMVTGTEVNAVDIVFDNPFGEPDPDGDVTVEGTIAGTPYVVVLTTFDDGLWCVTEATVDGEPLVTDGQMPLDRFDGSG